MFYLNPEQPSFTDMLNLVDQPLATLPQEIDAPSEERAGRDHGRVSSREARRDAHVERAEPQIRAFRLVTTVGLYNRFCNQHSFNGVLVAYNDLREWIAALDKAGELKRITAEVDPVLEVTEITDRVSKWGATQRPRAGRSGAAV